MDFKSADFREVVRNPTRFVATHQQPQAEQDGGSPQRPWLEACLRAYFKNGRSSDAALLELAKRASKSTSSSKVANKGAVGAMLEKFFALDLHEDQPEEYFPSPRNGAVGTHTLRLSPSLRYRLGPGFLVRHVWTERNFSLGRPYTKLIAAGYFAHAETVLGEGCVRQVEFWHLRSGLVRGWQAASLHQRVPDLIALLDHVASELDTA